MSFEEWKEVRLGDIASVQTGPFGSQLHQRDYREIGIPIITVEHLGENKVLHQNLPCVSDQDYNRLKKFEIKKGQYRN
jgi:type I restriction enzyme S subunit